MVSSASEKPVSQGENTAGVDVDTLPEISARMSNFDYRIDEGMEEALRSAPNLVKSSHTAWNFHACVWFDGAKFRSRVKQYQAIVGYYEADNLHDLMSIHNDLYGSD